MVKYKIDIKITGSNNKTESGSFYTPIRIGRKSDNDIVFQKSKDISRYHLRIEHKNEKPIVKNFSKNGYSLNDKKQMEAHSIAVGDIIKFNNSKKQLEILTITRIEPSEKEIRNEYRPSRIYKMVNAVKIDYQNKIQKQRYFFGSALFLFFMALLIFVVPNIPKEDSNYVIKKGNKICQDSSTIQNTKEEIQDAWETDRIRHSDLKKDTTEVVKKYISPPKILTDKAYRVRFNQMFKSEVVEVIYDLGNAKLTKNGFVHNGYIFSPAIEDKLFKEINQVKVKFKNFDKSFKLFLQSKETPFFRYKVENNEIVFNYRNTMEACTSIDINAPIFFIEYLQQKNRYSFQFYKGSIVLPMENSILSKINGKPPRLGALALTEEGTVIGLVTAFEQGNQVLIETINRINQKLSSLSM